MRAIIINVFFYMKITIFYLRLFQNTQQNASIINVFKKFLHEKLAHSKRVSKILIFLYKKLQFLKFVYKKC